MEANNAESPNVAKPIKAESGKGTAKALANAATESGVEMYTIEQRTSPITGQKEIAVFTGYECGEESEHYIAPKRVPANVHELITSWGYEISSHHDNTADNEQHHYSK